MPHARGRPHRLLPTAARHTRSRFIFRLDLCAIAPPMRCHQHLATIMMPRGSSPPRERRSASNRTPRCERFVYCSTHALPLPSLVLDDFNGPFIAQHPHDRPAGRPWSTGVATLSRRRGQHVSDLLLTLGLQNDGHRIGSAAGRDQPPARHASCVGWNGASPSPCSRRALLSGAALAGGNSKGGPQPLSKSGGGRNFIRL